MEPKWAEENLQTIRTLMERSAVYRRALAPIMIFAGILGSVAAMVGLFFHLGTTLAFGLLWLATAGVVVIGAFVITRQQALKRQRDILVGTDSPGCPSLVATVNRWNVRGSANDLVYAGSKKRYQFNNGLALAVFMAAPCIRQDFFMPRGIRLFGWIYIILACGCSFLMVSELEVTFPIFYNSDNANWLMGFFFGVLHLAYGAYLYLTEEESRRVNPEPYLQLDRLIHEKGRLAIMSMLAATPELTFMELRDALEMTDGNLTTHIKALQQEGYLSVAKSYQNNRPLTTCSLTAVGRKAFAEYINLLEQIVRQNKPK